VDHPTDRADHRERVAAPERRAVERRLDFFAAPVLLAPADEALEAARLVALTALVALVALAVLAVDAFGVDDVAGDFRAVDDLVVDVPAVDTRFGAAGARELRGARVALMSRVESVDAAASEDPEDPVDPVRSDAERVADELVGTDLSTPIRPLGLVWSRWPSR
jgi:hypothetical protein